MCIQFSCTSFSLTVRSYFSSAGSSDWDFHSLITCWCSCSLKRYCIHLQSWHPLVQQSLTVGWRKGWQVEVELVLMQLEQILNSLYQAIWRRTWPNKLELRTMINWANSRLDNQPIAISRFNNQPRQQLTQHQQHQPNVLTRQDILFPLPLPIQLHQAVRSGVPRYGCWANLGGLQSVHGLSRREASDLDHPCADVDASVGRSSVSLSRMFLKRQIGGT